MKVIQDKSETSKCEAEGSRNALFTKLLDLIHENKENIMNSDYVNICSLIKKIYDINNKKSSMYSSNIPINNVYFRMDVLTSKLNQLKIDQPLYYFESNMVSSVHHMEDTLISIHGMSRDDLMTMYKDYRNRFLNGDWNPTLYKRYCVVN